MLASPTFHPARAPWQRYPRLAFTALTALACPVLIRWLDKPLALVLHRYAEGAVPLFEWATTKVDIAYGVTMHTVRGLPLLLWALGLGYLLGRWVLRWRGATVLLLVLLTHVSSEVTANVLKVLTHRERPTFVAGTDLGGAFGSHGPTWDSFPSAHTAMYWSLFWPLALAFTRWRGPLLAVPVVVAVGRLVLGLHYLSDVWAAIWLVVAWAWLWQQLVAWAEARLARGPRRPATGA